MRFTAFLEIQLNPGTRDIEDIGDIGDLRDCRWAKPTNCAAITSTHPQGIYLGVREPRAQVFLGPDPRKMEILCPGPTGPRPGVFFTNI